MPKETEFSDTNEAGRRYKPAKKPKRNKPTKQENQASRRSARNEPSREDEIRRDMKQYRKRVLQVDMDD